MHLQTAFKKGSRDGIPRAEATTANALAVVFLTYSSMLSISDQPIRNQYSNVSTNENLPGLIVEIMVASPAALARLEMISRPSTLA